MPSGEKSRQVKEHNLLLFAEKREQRRIKFQSFSDLFALLGNDNKHSTNGNAVNQSFSSVEASAF